MGAFETRRDIGTADTGAPRGHTPETGFTTNYIAGSTARSICNKSPGRRWLPP